MSLREKDRAEILRDQQIHDLQRMTLEISLEVKKVLTEQKNLYEQLVKMHYQPIPPKYVQQESEIEEAIEKVSQKVELIEKSLNKNSSRIDKLLDNPAIVWMLTILFGLFLFWIGAWPTNEQGEPMNIPTPNIRSAEVGNSAKIDGV